MNVFDFDNTIYRGDSTADFILYNIKKQPSLSVYILRFACAYCFYKLRLTSKTKAKQVLFRMFGKVPSMEDRLRDFWADHMRNIKNWYPGLHRDDDVVISASPEFLILPACRTLNISHVMGSPVDMHTGTYTGSNCSGSEKPLRFRERYLDAVIENFFSDSLSDSPMAEISLQAYLVKGDNFFPWPSH